MRIAGRQLGLRDAVGMRAEHDGTGLGGAVAVADRGLGKHRVHLVDQRLGDGRGAHAHRFDRREIVAGQKLLLAQHHGDHGRHRGQELHAMTRGRLDVALGGELRQQDDRVALVQRGLAHGKTVHVIERCRHQRTLALRHRPAHALADRPEVRIVRQHHALGPARRARGVEEHRRFLGLHLQRRERTPSWSWASSSDAKSLSKETLGTLSGASFSRVSSPITSLASQSSTM